MANLYNVADGGGDPTNTAAALAQKQAAPLANPTPAQPQVSNPTNSVASITNPPSALAGWTATNDPTYINSMNASRASFNAARTNAMYHLNQQQMQLENQQNAMNQNSVDARRQLAGNFAARGMQRGGYGAYYRAQDKQNAALITANTDIKDQISALNQDFLANYGAVGSDWLGTSAGQSANQSAMQLAIQNRLAQVGNNG